MNRIHIIADGGGTTTNWCIVDGDERLFFTTESYHPSNWNPDFEERITTFWRKRIDPANVILTFFGAGCYHDENRNLAVKLFERIGFTDVTVLSDLHAAGLASLGKKRGWVAIAGTGSVLFEWDGEGVKHLIGGKGREVGDQGSGHYFGKLAIQAYQNGDLSKKQKSLFDDRISKSEFIELIENKSYSVLAQKLHSNDDLFEDFHQRNIRAFFEIHINSQTISSITFVGGYAWHKRMLFNEISCDFGIAVAGYLNEPIEPLVEQMVSFSE